MGVTTTTTLNDLVQPIIAEARMWFSDASLFFPRNGVAREYIQFADLTQKPAVAHTFPKLASIAFGDGVEDADYTDTSALTTSGVTVTSARKVCIVPVSDLITMGNVHGPEYIIRTVGEAVGRAAAEKFDADVCALFASLTTTPTGGNSSNSPMTAQEFRAYITALKSNKIPGPYAAFWHPHGWGDFLDESTSPLLNAAASDAVAKEVWQEFYCGNLFGVNCFQNAAVPNDGTDYIGGIFSKWAIGCTWKRDVVIEPQRDASAGWTEMVADMYYGVGVVDATAGYKMLQDID